MPSVKEQHSVCATEEPVGGPVELFLLCAKEWFGGGFKNDCFANLAKRRRRGKRSTTRNFGHREDDFAFLG